MPDTEIPLERRLSDGTKYYTDDDFVQCPHRGQISKDECMNMMEKSETCKGCPRFIHQVEYDTKTDDDSYSRTDGEYEEENEGNIYDTRPQ